VTAVRYLRRDPAGRYTALEARPATAEALDCCRTRRRLVPPHLGRRAQVRVRAARLPGQARRGHRHLLPAAVRRAVALARVRSDELCCGTPAARWPCGSADRQQPAANPATLTLGPDLAAGQQPQQLVPAGHWQAATPVGPQEVLVTSVVAPGLDFADFTVPPADGATSRAMTASR